MYRVAREQRPNTMGLDDSIYVLTDPATGSRAEVWPALGFNCYRWIVQRGPQSVNVLYADAQLFEGARPTRSGIPILFPFPNRIRDARFTWEGAEYQMLPSDPARKNAIHGFACFLPWRVVDQGADGASAWVTGEFHGSVDAANCRSFWPADYLLRLTVRLGKNSQTLEAEVRNPDQAPLPFGLGFHPYFRVPLVAGGSAADCLVQADAQQFWELRDSLPTGVRKSVEGDRDLRTPKPVAGLQLDDVLTDLRGDASVQQASANVTMKVRSNRDFRQLVVFTPPHRQAVCLEPYTCVTDAINLQAEGVDAGLLTLAPGQAWTGQVRLSVE